MFQKDDYLIKIHKTNIRTKIILFFVIGIYLLSLFCLIGIILTVELEPLECVTEKKVDEILHEHL